MQDHLRTLTTPPRWKELWFALALFLIIALVCFGVQTSTNLDIAAKTILVTVFGIDVLVMGIHYTITSERLVVKWLNIPLRAIRWDNISHAAYLHAWRDMIPVGKGRMTGMAYGHIIYVTLRGCKHRYLPDQNRWLHKVSHPFHTVCIWLPQDTRKLYIDLFAKYYASLEVQPIDLNKPY